MFNGAGGFKLTEMIDDVPPISGSYDPSKQPDVFRSKTFYFTYGVYPQHIFDYVRMPQGMKVSKVRLSN